MPPRVGRERDEAVTLLQRLRDLTPSWAITEHHARQIAERQARLLLGAAGVVGPPVPTEIVGKLRGIHVYPLPAAPVRGLLGASKSRAKGGDILIDATLPLSEQRVTLLHELKHIIDGGRSPMLHRRGGDSGGEDLCTEFALRVLMPAAWLRADWRDGIRKPRELAERYEVPDESVRQRLHALGLTTRRPRRRRRPSCQWHPSENEVIRRKK